MKILWRVLEILVAIFVFLLGIVGVALVAGLAGIYFFDINAHRPQIEREFNRITGYTLKLNGPIKIRLSPVPTFNLTDPALTFPIHSETVTVKANSLVFKINPSSFFSEYVHLYDINANHIVINHNITNKNSDTNTKSSKANSNVFLIDKFSGKFDTSPYAIEFSKIKAKFNQQTLEGKFKLLKISDILQLNVDFHSDQWKVEEGKATSIISFLADKSIAGRLDWKIDAFQFDGDVIKNMEIHLKKTQHDVKFVALGKQSGADFKANVVLTQLQKIPHADLDIDFAFMDSTVFARKILSNANISSKGLTLKLKGEADGFSLDEFKQSFKGKVEGGSQSIILHTLSLGKDNAGSPLMMNDVKFKIDFNKPNIEINSTGNLPGVAYKGQFWINHWPQSPEILADIHLKGNNASNFLRTISPGLNISGGVMEAHLIGKTKGNSFEDWKLKFKGHLFMHIQNLMVHGQAIDARLVDVFSLLFSSLNSGNKETMFECVASRFHVNNGILISQDNFAVETSDIYALGTGTIDFGKEWLGLTFDVYPREKLPLQVGAYDNVVSIRGPMSKPNVDVGGNGLIAKGGSIALGIATGGLSSLVEKFLHVINHKGSPCAKVLANPDK